MLNYKKLERQFKKLVRKEYRDGSYCYIDKVELILYFEKPYYVLHINYGVANDTTNSMELSLPDGLHINSKFICGMFYQKMLDKDME